MKKVIIIGASSGIGSELAKLYAAEGWYVGMTARRVHLLETLAASFPHKNWMIRAMDTALSDESRNILAEMIKDMQGVDVFIYNAGVGINSAKWDIEHNTIHVNAVGFAALTNYVFHYFKSERKKGQIVGISSVAGRRGMRSMIAYSATKAFMSTYMEGLRQEVRAKKLPIAISDIRPGFVETPMTQGQKGMFWVVSASRAAQDIFRAVSKEKSVAYIPYRWTLVAKIIENIPDFIWERM
ncbi:MAG: SDR family NAD(P)-dependent oxidoreductase [Chitinophagales bacterium]|nr:SDR family NAD(P)-dependent oxidoreductase [Chitinophagales bacterium]